MQAYTSRILGVDLSTAGTYAPGSGRFGVYAKSPLTGIFGEAYSGGSLAHEMRFAGYEAIVVHGRAAGPVFLLVDDGKVELRDALSIWGKETAEAANAIRREIGDEDCRIVAVGKAGEKMIRFACIMNDSDRAAGRTGLGAVMGSKNLRDIAVRGRGDVRVADLEGFRRWVLPDMQKIRASPMFASWASSGTPLYVEGAQRLGRLPTQNWDAGTFAGASRIGAQAMKDSILLGNRACTACPIGCGRVVQVRSGPFTGTRPEYRSACSSAPA